MAMVPTTRHRGRTALRATLSRLLATTAGPPIDIPAEGRLLPPLTAAALERMNEYLDGLAEYLARMPDQQLSIGQRRLAKALAAELMRRAADDEHWGERL